MFHVATAVVSMNFSYSYQLIILQTEKIQLTEGVTQDPRCTVIYEETVTHQAIRFYVLIAILRKVILEYAHIRGQVDERTQKENFGIV